MPEHASEIFIEQENAPLKVTRTRMGVVTYLAPAGMLFGEDELAPLRDALDQCLAKWETQVVIDLSSVPLVRSSALELLLDVQESLTRAGGWLKVSRANPVIRDVLRMTCLDASIGADGEEGTGGLRVATARPGSVRLGDILVEKQLLSDLQVQEAIALQNETGRRFGQIVVDKGWLDEKALFLVLGEQLGVPYVDLRPGLYDRDVSALLDASVARRLNMLPLFRIRDSLYVATSEPQAAAGFGEIEERTSLRVRPVLATSAAIVKSIADAASDSGLGAGLLDGLDGDLEVVENKQPDDYAAIDDMAGGSPVINMVNSIIQRAVSDKASDIHIEPSQKVARIRFRVDGLLYEVMAPRIELHPAIVSRLKVMANLDIAERRLPQDGRIQVYTQGRQIDLRFSSLPGLFGEKVVLRVLDKNQAILDIDKLGMRDSNESVLRRLLDRSHGLILVTGPTGSGKTTSLYAAINYLNSIEKNIVTIEDPVEYQLEVVNQNPVKEQIGLTYARMLKHVLRQDPDVIMVGEIRDRETAEIAVQAALTGHLVLSTLHTNDSVGAVTRMIDMGIEPYLLSSALIGVVAQRLVRGICSACKTEYLAGPDIIERYGWQDQGKVRLSRGRGCPECYDSGYRGRMAVHEIVEADHRLRHLIMNDPSREASSAFLTESGIDTMFDDGLRRVLQGRTTIEEIARVVSAG